jgi:crossover junction endodeoxyribonuclease RuvC
VTHRPHEVGGSGAVILGIDPGTTGMGFAILDPSREPPVVIDRGLIATPKLGTTAERLVAIADAIDALIARHRPAHLALERLYFNKNVKTAMVVAEARGIALVCAARASLTVAEYTPQEVKLSVTGSGSADKAQVQRMLYLVLGLGEPITQDNVADAVAIALTHAQRLRFSAAVARAQ